MIPTETSTRTGDRSAYTAARLIHCGAEVAHPAEMKPTKPMTAATTSVRVFTNARKASITMLTSIAGAYAIGIRWGTTTVHDVDNETHLEHVAGYGEPSNHDGAEWNGHEQDRRECVPTWTDAGNRERRESQRERRGDPQKDDLAHERSIPVPVDLDRGALVTPNPSDHQARQ
ncbi:MAG: hypothetical protein R2695_08120 [Acidimicrobiales bacterium]